jgi:succinate-semialdehyde dehydrogenase/glutarate-semialdehyde dehydrogenase
VVVRPAPATPSAALALGEALVAAGWPPDAVSVLPCDDVVAALLVADARFPTVASGRDGPAAAWTTTHVRRRTLLIAAALPVTLLIEPDADLERAVRAIVNGAFSHAGQTRAWAHRVLVHAAVWAEVCARFAAAARAFPRGDPARDDVLCGPLVDRRGLARAEAWMRAAEQLGGERLAGGEREGPVFTPAAITGEAPYFELLDGAPGGPVAVLEPYAHLDAAVDRVNGAPRGDTGLFTGDVRKVWRVFERLEVGSLVHDAHPDHVEGGCAASRAALDALLTPRTLRLGGDAVVN